MKKGERELLTPRQAADAFSVDIKTVSRWEKEGRIRCVRTLGGHRRFYRTDIEELGGVVEAHNEWKKGHHDESAT